jgi:hypothetical protein
MNDALLFLHFVGLILAMGPGTAQSIIMRRAAAATPEAAMTLRGLAPTLSAVSAAGLAVLWVTGLIMVWSVYGGPASLPWAFWVKIAAVVLITLVVIYIQMTFAEVRRGNAAAAGRLAQLGPAAGILGLVAVLFAVIAFH